LTFQNSFTKFLPGLIQNNYLMINTLAQYLLSLSVGGNRNDFLPAHTFIPK